MMQVRLTAVSLDEREELEAAFCDFEQHFAELLRVPRMPRPFEGDPFATPGRKVYWLDWQGKRYGFVVLDRVQLPPAEIGGQTGFPQVEATQINRYGVFSEFRHQGWGSAGLPLLEAYAMTSGCPLTWSCWLINPALSFWERWTQELARRGWRVEKRLRESSPPARTYTVWPPEAEAMNDSPSRRSYTVTEPINFGGDQMTAELFSQLEERGYKGRIVAVEHLRDLQEGIEGPYRQGHFDEGFYQEWLTSFLFKPPDNLPDARSLIVVAVPQPQIQVTFTWACPVPCPERSRGGSRRDGEPVRLIVPPTYLRARETDQRVRDLLAQVLELAGCRVAEAVLPKKLLAVRSGLAAYGKNNITYVPGMGSFHRLVAVYSDLPCREDNWQEPQMMESCQNCSACLRHCPVGAITSDRFLLHAERCITFHNEKPGDVPFPAWIEPSWHNCLVGCLHCQMVCPQNKELLSWVEEGPEFSQEETALLLQGVALDQLPPATAKKLEQADLVNLLEALPRNLGVLLNGKGGQGGCPC